MKTISQQLHLGVFQVMRSPYHRLNLMDMHHPYWAISTVVEGNVTSICRGERFSVRAGDAMIHPPQIPYSEIAEVPGVHEWFLFEAQTIPNLDLLRVHPVFPVVHLQDREAFARAFQALLLTWETPDAPFRDLRLFAHTAEILQLVLTGWNAMGSPPRPARMQTTEDRFTEVMTFMTDHLGEKLTRDDLAGKLCLHPVYFDRLFRATYGLPPMTLLRRMRLDRARHLLESTDDTLASIAERCGFATASHLSRHFSERFEHTPGEHRENFRRIANGDGHFRS